MKITTKLNSSFQVRNIPLSFTSSNHSHSKSKDRTLGKLGISLYNRNRQKQTNELPRDRDPRFLSYVFSNKYPKKNTQRPTQKTDPRPFGGCRRKRVMWPVGDLSYFHRESKGTVSPMPCIPQEIAGLIKGLLTIGFPQLGLAIKTLFLWGRWPLGGSP